MKLSTAVAIALTIGGAPLFAQSTTDGGFQLSTLSARSNMVSGGDVLIRIVPPGSDVNNIIITVNGRAANAKSKPTTDGNTALLALLKDLNIGKNDIAVGFKGQRPAVHLAVVNHPITGPVLSGLHQTPFKCETQAFGFGPPLDADCTVATRVEYYYRSISEPQGAN